MLASEFVAKITEAGLPYRKTNTVIYIDAGKYEYQWTVDAITQVTPRKLAKRILIASQRKVNHERTTTTNQ